MNHCELGDVIVDSWRGCYDGGWNGEICLESFAHPAKVSRALICRIYQHAFVEGWLVPGDVVVDPFGGIGGTALDAMWNGLTWIGVELEPRFVALADANLDLWRRKYGSKPGFGAARILQGDSRKLSEIIATADLVCSSPPFHDSMSNKPSAQILAGSGGRMGESCKSDDVYGQSPGQLGAMKEGEAPRVDCVVSSPPFAQQQTGGGIAAAVHGRSDYPVTTKRPTKNSGYQEQAGSDGNLASMPEGKFSAVVSSPPYAAIAAGAGGLNTLPGKDGQQSGRSSDSASQGADQHYGESAGQLSAMAEGDVAAVISSPPFQGCEPCQDDKFRLNDGRTKPPQDQGGYGTNPSNIGNQSGDTFWQAAREIVAQCHAILKPGGYAIWVCKDFVRKGKRVPFSDQWQALCEAQGFRLVCRHRAMLVAHYGEQDDMLGATKQLTTARKSFFRRLAEAKGSPAIDWEDVICLERTAQQGLML